MKRPVRFWILLVTLAFSAHATAEEPENGDAAEDYLLHCSACHRADGTGTEGVMPTLHGLGAVLAADGGRTYLARVPGVAQAPLSDARVARLLNWVLRNFSGVDVQPPYRSNEVAELRRSPLRDPIAARAALGVD